MAECFPDRPCIYREQKWSSTVLSQPSFLNIFPLKKPDILVFFNVVLRISCPGFLNDVFVALIYGKFLSLMFSPIPVPELFQRNVLCFLVSQ